MIKCQQSQALTSHFESFWSIVHFGPFSIIFGHFEHFLLFFPGDPDKMFYNCDLETIAKQAFADHLWQNENPDPSWIKGIY